MGNNYRIVLEEWRRLEFPKIIGRYIQPKLSNDIVAIIGPRRAGKTYLLLWIAKNLLADYPRENILYVNFDDERIKREKFENLFAAYSELFSPSGDRKIVLLLDEIQLIEKWDGWLRTLHNQNKYFLFVAGSSSKLLSREISTSLRGRYVSYLLLPFSFREYLNIKNIGIPDVLLPADRGVILRHLEEYITFGGFPEVILSSDEMEKRKKLQSLYESIFYKDILERFKIRNYDIAKEALDFFVSNYANRMTISKIHGVFKSSGKEISKKTLWRYFSEFQDAFALFALNPYVFSKKKQMVLPRKIYSVDTGISLMLSKKEDKGRLMENIAFLELMRRSEKEMTEIYYYLIGEKEIDFVIKLHGRIEQLIQVCYDVENFATKERELSALQKASNELNCNNLLMLTWDYENVEQYKEKEIKFIPLWKWLLNL